MLATPLKRLTIGRDHDTRTLVEFLVNLAFQLPEDFSAGQRAQLLAAERDRGLELVRDGTIVRIWRLPGAFANVAIWSCVDATELHDRLTSLPLYPWAIASVTALATHPLESGSSSASLA